MRKTIANEHRKTGASHGVLGGALLAAAGVLCFAQAAAAQDKPADDKVILGPVKVEDTRTKNNVKRDTGLPTMPGTLQDTPQAANIITQETMQQQGVASLEMALRNVPGITISIGEGGTLAGDQFKIRGFEAKDDIYYDGLRDFGSYTRDSFNFEEVQVLKGPSGLMFGRGTTGGVINTVSKTPFLDTGYTLQAMVGNGDYYRGLADVNYQIGDTSAIRINVMGTDQHVVDRDVVYSKRWGVAPSIAWGLGTGTTLTLSYLHQHDDRIPDYGITIIQRPGDIVAVPASENGLPRNTFLGYNTDKDRTDTDMVTLRASHQALPWLTLTNDTRFGFYERYFQYTTIDRCDNTANTANCAAKFFGPTPSTAQGGIGGGGPYDQDAWGWQDIFTARAENDLGGGMKNELIAGFDYNYQHSDKAFFAYTLPTALQYTYAFNGGVAARANIGQPLFNPSHNPPPFYAPFRPTLATIAGTSATATMVLDSTGKSSDFALFATDRFWFAEDWSLIAGVRWDDYTSDYTTVLVNGTVTPAKVDIDFFSPRAALVFEPDENQTYYVSWSNSSTPQSTSVVNSGTAVTAVNSILEPETNKSWEAGAKIGLFDGALGLTASVFDVTKGNAFSIDPASLTADAQSGEKQRVRGIELSATGEITKGWSVQAAYTYLDSETLESFTCAGTPSKCVLNPFIVGKPVIFVPKNSGSLWTTYEFYDDAPGLTIAGGVTYTGDYNTRYTTTGTPPSALTLVAHIPESISLDAVVSYELANWRFALNGYNLTDRLNYSQAFGNRGTPAPGRAFVFSVGFKS